MLRFSKVTAQGVGQNHGTYLGSAQQGSRPLKLSGVKCALPVAWYRLGSDIHRVHPQYPGETARSVITGSATSSGDAQVVDEFSAVELSVHYKVAFGECVKVVGSCPELGAWDPVDAPALTWSAGDVWTETLTMPAGLSAEFKMVVFNTSKKTTVWEPQPDNRKLETPSEPGLLVLSCEWGVSDVSPTFFPASSSIANSTLATPQRLSQPGTSSDSVNEVAVVVKHRPVSPRDKAVNAIFMSFDEIELRHRSKDMDMRGGQSLDGTTTASDSDAGTKSNTSTVTISESVVDEATAGVTGGVDLQQPAVEDEPEQKSQPRVVSEVEAHQINTIAVVDSAAAEEVLTQTTAPTESTFASVVDSSAIDTKLAKEIAQTEAATVSNELLTTQAESTFVSVSSAVAGEEVLVEAAVDASAAAHVDTTQVLQEGSAQLSHTAPITVADKPQTTWATQEEQTQEASAAEAPITSTSPLEIPAVFSATAIGSVTAATSETDTTVSDASGDEVTVGSPLIVAESPLMDIIHVVGIPAVEAGVDDAVVQVSDLSVQSASEEVDTQEAASSHEDTGDANVDFKAEDLKAEVVRHEEKDAASFEPTTGSLVQEVVQDVASINAPAKIAQEAVADQSVNLLAAWVQTVVASTSNEREVQQESSSTHAVAVAVAVAETETDAAPVHDVAAPVEAAELKHETTAEAVEQQHERQHDTRAESTTQELQHSNGVVSLHHTNEAATEIHSFIETSSNTVPPVQLAHATTEVPVEAAAEAVAVADPQAEVQAIPPADTTSTNSDTSEPALATPAAFSSVLGSSNGSTQIEPPSPYSFFPAKSRSPSPVREEPVVLAPPPRRPTRTASPQPAAAPGKRGRPARSKETAKVFNFSDARADKGLEPGGGGNAAAALADSAVIKGNAPKNGGRGNGSMMAAATVGILASVVMMEMQRHSNTTAQLLNSLSSRTTAVTVSAAQNLKSVSHAGTNTFTAATNKIAPSLKGWADALSSL